MTFWVSCGSSLPMSANIEAKVGTTKISITATALIDTHRTMIGYISALMILLRNWAAASICSARRCSTSPSRPEDSPLFTSWVHSGLKSSGKAPRASLSDSPEATRPATSFRTTVSCLLSDWSLAITSAW